MSDFYKKNSREELEGKIYMINPSDTPFVDFFREQTSIAIKDADDFLKQCVEGARD